jgi:Xaa-Pro aminopeptidase
MRQVVRALWVAALLAPAVPAGSAAQEASAPATIPEFPGQGRPVDIPATTARRQRLMDRLGDAVVLIPAAHERSGEAYGDYPQDTDFRQHNTFFYYTMLEQPDAWLVLHARTGGPDESLLLLPDRDPMRERWVGVKIGPGELATRLTGLPTLSLGKLDSVVAAATAGGVPVYVQVDRGTQHEAVIQRLRADSARIGLRNLRPIADSMRLVKDAQEVAVLRRAVRISAEAHAELMREAREGMAEYELEAILEAGFRRRGGDRVGYPSIVGSGFNGTTLHYMDNRALTRPGDLVVVDAAAEHAQYTADVTRTFPISGRFTTRQRAIYDLVLATQQAALDSVRPGITMGRLGQIARAYMQAHSGDLCPVRPGETAQDPTCARYFIHGLGHWIGMDVHDVGGYNLPLAPGMVLTVEPGIYIPAESLGVRIEDDVLVTENGYELLSAAAPRRAEEIERLMATNRGSDVRRQRSR